MSNLVHVKGLQELDKMLKLVTVQMETKIMRGALYVGAKVIRDEAKRLAPVSPPSSKNRRIYKGYAGALRDSIRAGAMVNRRAGKVFAYVRAGSHGKNRKGKGADAYYARWVEYGTGAHLITINGDGRLAARANRKAKKGSLRIGDNFVGPVVKHKGAKPSPFLRPALDAKAQEALLAAGMYIRKRLATKEGLTQAADVELEAA